MIKLILFDFGGVLAEEGFREGLKEIARKNRLDPDRFYAAADAIIYETGYLTGKAGESDFWNAVRQRTGIDGTDRDLREKILKRFVPRPHIIGCADLLRSKGFKVALLTDQTNWLDEIKEKTGFDRHFDYVLNSFRTHLTKRNASTFQKVCGMLRVKPGETLFVDDNKNHIDRADSQGLKTLHFTSFDNFGKQMQTLTGTSCKK